MLTNKAYIGIIDHNGECFEGSFPAIVSKATFDKVQEVLKLRARPRHSEKSHNFPFVGIFRCGECGAMITAQYAHGNGGTYRYYRCTKRLGRCSQKYLSEIQLVEQLKTEFSKVALCEDWEEKMLAQVEIWEKEAKSSSHIFVQNLEGKIKTTDEKLDKLINAFLDGDIEKETYLKKKEELIKTKKDLSGQKSDFGRKGNNWIEPLKEWILSAHQAEKLAFGNDFHEMKSFVKKIGTNHQLFNKKMSFQYKAPFNILLRYKGEIEQATARKAGWSEAPKSIKIPESCIWSNLLNEVRTFFEQNVQ